MSRLNNPSWRFAGCAENTEERVAELSSFCIFRVFSEGNFLIQDPRGFFARKLAQTG